MRSKWTYIVMGAILGTTASVVLAVPSIIPDAIADELPMKALTATKTELLELFGEPAEFFKPQWTVEDSVSTEVISSAKIRKIEGGRTSFVTVATTASGVYSSDGLTSRHVRYPGIHSVQERHAALAMLTGGGWVFFTAINAGSSLEVIPTETGGAIVGGGSVCHFVNGSMYC